MNKILIVDDEPDIHELLKIYLERIKDVEIISAFSGEEGVKIYEELFRKGEKPSLVIMDLNLSGKNEIELDEIKMDGIRATQRILKIDPDAIIWGYTAWFGTKWAEELRRVGAKIIFGRTTPFKEFSKMVERFLQERKSFLIPYLP
ncbi:MAG: response regulator [Thermoplasmatales archaeon]|nr:response regulator [Thermoplasmatales archaeon]